MKSKLSTRLLKILQVTSIAIAIGVALMWLILQGYSASWTGFGDYTRPDGEFVRGKTLWDWMQLFLVSLTLSVGLFFLNRAERENERKRAEERANLEREIATDRQQEAALQSYFEKMFDLLLKDKLLTNTDKEVRDVARTRTLTVLRGLDATRKLLVVVFLREAGLIDKGNRIVDLTDADFENVDWSGDWLNGVESANLENVNLTGANLKNAVLIGVNLQNANLSSANLKNVDLSSAELMNADLSSASLTFSKLTRANLENVNLEKTHLQSADLNDANLTGANLMYADLSGTHLNSANLTNANLKNANLGPHRWYKLHESESGGMKNVLDEVDLSHANMEGAEVTQEQLAKVKSLKGAIMPDGTKHD